MNSATKTKLAWVAATVGSVVLAGSIATASAQHGNGNDNDNGDQGYAKEQCMNGGWRNFTNPDGSQKFKNQGQCIAFFNHNGSGGDQGNNNGNGNQGNNGSGGVFHFGSDFTSWLSNLFSWLSHLFGGL